MVIVLAVDIVQSLQAGSTPMRRFAQWLRRNETRGAEDSLRLNRQNTEFATVEWGVEEIGNFPARSQVEVWDIGLACYYVSTIFESQE